MKYPIPSNLLLFAEGVSKLFHPYAEVVIHDLEKNKIVSLYGPLSPRKVGDSSYLSSADRSLLTGVYGPYSKLSPEGKAMKSISVVFPEANQQRYMVCINFDISEFQKIHSVMTNLISLSGMPRLEDIFEENWQDKIHQFINESLRERGVTLGQLTRDYKKALVFELRNKGAFNNKNAASYIAQILGVSRASIYGYLKEKNI